MKESKLLKSILLTMTEAGHRFFRNNVGQAWVGKTPGPAKKAFTTTVNRGDLVIRKARRFRSGFPVGSSDLIGWRSTKITNEMVGDTVAVFAAIEAKTQGIAVTEEQANFTGGVNRAGGIGIIARENDDVLSMIEGSFR